MANAVTSRILVDGTAITHLEIVGILDTSDLSGFVVADIATLENTDILGRRKGVGLGVVGIPNYSISDGLEITIYFDAPVPDILSVLTGRGSMNYDKEGYRSCQNSSPTGKIMISTLGVVPGGSTSTFTLKLNLRKQTN